MNTIPNALIAAGALALAACGGPSHSVPSAQAAEIPGVPFVIRDTTIAATFTATGVAEPFAQATLSTKLMGTVTSVLVTEGDHVAQGQVLLQIDARDIEAKREQARAAIMGAEAVQREAALQATRWRALYADSAAPRAQVDAAEAALARADAGLQTAQAAQVEIATLGAYATIRSPFAGTVTQRLVDPGAFAAPGTPLVSVLDDSRLRIAAAVPPPQARQVRRGMTLDATIEGTAVKATVEGVIPASQRTTGSELFTINALVPNGDRSLPSLGAATLSIPAGTRVAILVPAEAIRREGDLTGVVVLRGATHTVRWIKLGDTVDGLVEVTAGLRVGDSIRVPRAAAR